SSCLCTFTRPVPPHPPTSYEEEKRVPEAPPPGKPSLKLDPPLSRLERRRSSIHRDQHRALKDLQDLKAHRPQLQPPAEPLPSPCVEKRNPEIGFVPEECSPDPIAPGQPAPADLPAGSKTSEIPPKEVA